MFCLFYPNYENAGNLILCLNYLLRPATTMFFHFFHRFISLSFFNQTYRFYTDPSGTFWQCDAKSIGSGVEAADIALKEQYNKEMTLEEAETLALTILKQVMEDKVTPNNVDIASVAPTYHLYTLAEVERVINRL
eukprot:TRINITY_DN10543_c0_g1_i3.p1 TRINITY_DN10543_c0_g1~~TRINITY_DN10543_c0_g1_i3.p1  ORF type:complete len:135 (-),score=18.40 TRINITY_DN10543_c0_g1_i3:27-431(-)